MKTLFDLIPYADSEKQNLNADDYGTITTNTSTNISTLISVMELIGKMMMDSGESNKDILNKEETNNLGCLVADLADIAQQMHSVNDNYIFHAGELFEREQHSKKN